MTEDRLSSSTEAALRERVKELSCLYGIAQIAARPDMSMDQILQGIVDLLPPAWQFPEITVGKIDLDGRTYSTPALRGSHLKQTADIVVNGKSRGVVEVMYVVENSSQETPLFLKEEQSLLDTVGQQVALIIEQQQSHEEKQRLQEQLRHADRLATIGQLAAGIAHELNEPLNNMLGLAELARQARDVPEQYVEDNKEMITLLLHAREIVKKLMFFARQVPAQKTSVDISKIIEEGLHFLEPRCVSSGIELVRSLSRDLPEITADPSQLNQVLVNLVVNAIQAMPNGGTLRIAAFLENKSIKLVVEDTGIGMSEDVLKQVFIPFFTTKDIDMGTGLGLPVAHGIITSHGGTIDVTSTVGEGTRFELQLPLAGSKSIKEKSHSVVIQ